VMGFHLLLANKASLHFVFFIIFDLRFLKDGFLRDESRFPFLGLIINTIAVKSEFLTCPIMVEFGMATKPFS
jgi:hypothetical protein